jgi:hypothetical protein
MKLLINPLHCQVTLLTPVVALAAALCIAPFKGGVTRTLVGDGPTAHAVHITSADKSGANASIQRPRVASFVGDFESGDLSAWSHREAARPDTIQIVTDTVRRGRYAAKFTVRPGERVSNGNRAELTWDNRELPGSESWYAWSFLIPPEYSDVEWKPRSWQCMGQWHDQPNRERGETWDKFPGHSPSIAIYYTLRKGVQQIELWYGAHKEQRIIATSPIQKGRWNDLVFHIGWSPSDDGFVEAWLNGKPFTPVTGNHHKVMGANMWNDYPHFLKIGLYRNSDIGTTDSVYFDEVRVGNSYAEVALPEGVAPTSASSPKPTTEMEKALAPGRGRP